jgi:hypothetical protein
MLDQPLTDKELLEQERNHYKNLLTRIKAALTNHSSGYPVLMIGVNDTLVKDIQAVKD